LAQEKQSVIASHPGHCSNLTLGINQFTPFFDMFHLSMHLVCLLAILTRASADEPNARSSKGQVLMQTGQIAPVLRHHVDKIDDFDSNELELLLLAESTDAIEVQQAELDMKEWEGTTTLADEGDMRPITFLAAYTLGLAALLPDVLAFATALLGFKILGAVLLPTLFGPATDATKLVEEESESEDDSVGHAQFFPIVTNRITRMDGTDVADDFGCTALHVAAHNGSAPQVLELLEARAHANAREAWGETPLHMAARTGSTAACHALLMHGADLDAMNADEKTPLVLAAQAGHEPTCGLLLDRGAGAGDMADDELPLLLKSVLMQRLLLGSSSAHAVSSEQFKC